MYKHAGGEAMSTATFASTSSESYLSAASLVPTPQSLGMKLFLS